MGKETNLIWLSPLSWMLSVMLSLGWATARRKSWDQAADVYARWFEIQQNMNLLFLVISFVVYLIFGDVWGWIASTAMAFFFIWATFRPWSLLGSAILGALGIISTKQKLDRKIRQTVPQMTRAVWVPYGSWKR